MEPEPVYYVLGTTYTGCAKTLTKLYDIVPKEKKELKRLVFEWFNRVLFSFNLSEYIKKTIARFK